MAWMLNRDRLDLLPGDYRRVDSFELALQVSPDSADDGFVQLRVGYVDVLLNRDEISNLCTALLEAREEVAQSIAAPAGAFRVKEPPVLGPINVVIDANGKEDN